MLVIKKNTLILAGAAVVAVMVAVGTAFSYRTKETFAPNEFGYCGRQV